MMIYAIVQFSSTVVSLYIITQTLIIWRKSQRMTWYQPHLTLHFRLLWGEISELKWNHHIFKMLRGEFILFHIE